MTWSDLLASLEPASGAAAVRAYAAETAQLVAGLAAGPVRAAALRVLAPPGEPSAADQLSGYLGEAAPGRSRRPAQLRCAAGFVVVVRRQVLAAWLAERDLGPDECQGLLRRARVSAEEAMVRALRLTCCPASQPRPPLGG